MAHSDSIVTRLLALRAAHRLRMLVIRRIISPKRSNRKLTAHDDYVTIVLNPTPILVQDGFRTAIIPLGNQYPSKAGSYPIEVKGWRVSELVRVPLARQENRRVNNNFMHAERVEPVSLKQTRCPSIATEKRCEPTGVSS